MSQSQTEASTIQAQADRRGEAVSRANQAELARRRLVEWCVSRELPVPAEQRAPHQPRR